MLAADVKTMEAKTAQGQSVKLKVSDAGVTVDNAKVIKTDLLAEKRRDPRDRPSDLAPFMNSLNPRGEGTQIFALLLF